MTIVDFDSLRVLVEAAVTAISVLGGSMALASGRAAKRAVLNEASAEVLSAQVNEGLASGFDWGARFALFAFIIVL